MLSALWPAHGNFRRHRAQLKIHEDVSYASDASNPKRCLDVFAPAQKPVTGPVPAVLFVHGGAERAQDRKHNRALSGLYSNVGAAFAREGFVGVVLGYRQLPEATLPESLEDVRAALSAWKGLAPKYGADPTRVVLVGHDAGGHLAMSAAMMGGSAVDALRAVVSLAGFYDVERYAQSMHASLRAGFDAYCGNEPSVAAALSPARRPRDVYVPALLGMSERETDALRAEQDAMDRALREVLSPVESFVAHECGHDELVAQMGSPDDGVTPVIAAFARKHTKPHR